MIKIISALLTLAGATATWAQGIDFFQGSFEEAIDKARREGKILFVDVYTEWCGPCKKMAKEVFPDASVGDYYNANFVNYKLDAEDEHNNGPEVAEKYQVSAYPTFLFLNHNGKVVDTAKGGLGKDIFLDVAKRVNGEAETFEQLAEKYQAGERSEQFLFNYFSQAKLVMLSLPKADRNKFFAEVSEQAVEYLDGLNNEQLMTVEVFQIIQNYTVGPNRGQSLSEFVVDNYSSYIELITPKDVAEYIGRINYESIKQLAEAGDDSYKPYIEDVRGKLASAYAELGPRFRGDDPYISIKEFAESAYSLAVEDWARYLDICQAHVERMGDHIQVSTLVSISKDLLDAGCVDTEQLQRAVGFNRLAYEKKNTLFTSVSYARLLAQLDDPRAKPVLEDVVAQCEEMGPRADKVKEEFQAILAAM